MAIHHIVYKLQSNSMVRSSIPTHTQVRSIDFVESNQSILAQKRSPKEMAAPLQIPQQISSIFPNGRYSIPSPPPVNFTNAGGKKTKNHQKVTAAAKTTTVKPQPQEDDYHATLKALNSKGRTPRKSLGQVKLIYCWGLLSNSWCALF